MGQHKDISGFKIFDAGDLGHLHVVAHDMLDRGLYAEGHRLLEQGLDGQRGDGSDWVHVQWHQLVFELALGRWQPARDRFDAHVLPAVRGHEALTDGPAGLWRLRLAAGRDVRLPWHAVHEVAVARIDDPGDPFVTLHHLLALAGAGDLDGLDGWLARDTTAHAPGLPSFALGLLAYSEGDWDAAASRLEQALPAVHSLGGSSGQNGLFAELCRDARRRAVAAAA